MGLVGAKMVKIKKSGKCRLKTIKTKQKVLYDIFLKSELLYLWSNNNLESLNLKKCTFDLRKGGNGKIW